MSLRAAALLLLVTVGCSRRDRSITADDAHAAPTKVDLAALAGRWTADGSKRRLDARLENGRLRFHVVASSEWASAYADDEVRFELIAPENGAVGELRVLDVYRPFVLRDPFDRYSDAALESCTIEVHEALGAPLSARIAADGGLEVDFAEVRLSLSYAETGAEVTRCDEAKVVGRLRRTLHRNP